MGGVLCKIDQEPHVFLNNSDKNGTSKLEKMTIFDQKWNFCNPMAKFNNKPTFVPPSAQQPAPSQCISGAPIDLKFPGLKFISTTTLFSNFYHLDQLLSS